MRVLRYAMLACGLTAVVISVSYFTSLFAQPPAPEDPRPAAIENLPPVPDEGVEVQTSGPVHEAFASPLSSETPESIVVNKEPPQPIEELPPEQRPEGDNVVWIPGYFGWDEDRRDFIWMSGFWRDVPPGRAWVSGYWTKAADGWQWVPGFFTSAEQPQVTYLPEPPETIEEGPSIEQPSANHFWVPGHWFWAGDHYVWRPGYWARIQPEWLWIPAHYVWCPSGYVFVDGYWDYPVERRGILFAPVYFRPVVFHRHYFFTPSIVWSTHLFTRHLWVRPAYYHYYYGDFYDDRYADWGIRPWYLSFTFGRTSYDPLFSYYRWYNRDRDWTRDVRSRYDFYRQNRDARPPRTYRDQQRLVSRGDRNVIRDSVVAAPLAQVTSATGNNIINANFRTPFRFDRVQQQERRQIARQSDELRNVVRQRQQLETRENVARVEGGERGGARKGEDARVRRPAPRALDISGVAQAIGGTTTGRGPGDKAGKLREPQVGPRPRASDIARPDAADDAAKGKGPDAVRRGAGRVDRTTPDITRPDRGPDVKGLGRGPDLKGPDRGPDLKGLGRVPDVKGPDRGPDAKGLGRGPDVKGPDRGPDLKGLGRVPDAKGADRGPDVKGSGRGPDAKGPDRRPDTKTPDRTGERKGRPLAPGLGGPDLTPDRRPDITRPPERRPDATRLDTGRPVPREPRRDLRDLGPPTTTAPDARRVEPPSRVREPAPGRGPAPDGSSKKADQGPVERGKGRPERAESRPAPLTVSPRLRPGPPDPGAATRQPRAETRVSRPDAVAPLRLGGPTPAPRATPAPQPQVRSRPEVPPPVTRGADRAAPSAARSVPSPRVPTAEIRPRDREEEKRKPREKK